MRYIPTPASATILVSVRAEVGQDLLEFIETCRAVVQDGASLIGWTVASIATPRTSRDAIRRSPPGFDRWIHPPAAAARAAGLCRIF